MTEGDVATTVRTEPAIKLRQPERGYFLGVSNTRRLVVVSNRVTPTAAARPDSGGLAVAIRAALQQSGGIWFGWSGEVTDETSIAPKIAADGPLTFATLDLSRNDFNEYYIGYANRVLWPLFHCRTSLVEFSRRYLTGYLRVNRLFAQVLAPMLSPEDLVWIHDYHLIPLGEELRKRDSAQPIGFFLHTPFPAAELLRVLPNHQELVRSLCAYDLVGFQTQSDLDGFRDYFRHLTEYEPKRAAQFGIKHYSWLCINAKEAENVALSRQVREFWLPLGDVTVDVNGERRHVARVENLLTGEQSPIEWGGIRLRIDPHRDPALLFRCLA